MVASFERKRLGVRRRIAAYTIAKVVCEPHDEEAPDHIWKSKTIFGIVLGFFSTLVSQSSTGKDPFQSHPTTLSVSAMSAIVCFFSSLTIHLNPDIRVSIKHALNAVTILSGCVWLQSLAVIVLPSRIGLFSYLFILVVLVILVAVIYPQLKFGKLFLDPISSSDQVDALQAVAASVEEQV